MTRQIINIGTGPDSYTGDNLRTAFTKVNDNFAQLYAGNVGANTTINVLTANTVSTNGNVNAGNVLVQYQVIASGNVSAPIFLGNGRYLTGILASANLGNLSIGGPTNQTIIGAVPGSLSFRPFAGNAVVMVLETATPGSFANLSLQGFTNNLTTISTTQANANLRLSANNATITMRGTDNHMGFNGVPSTGYDFNFNGEINANAYYAQADFPVGYQFNTPGGDTGMTHDYQNDINGNVSLVIIKHDSVAAAKFYDNNHTILSGNLVVSQTGNVFGAAYPDAFMQAYANVNSYSQTIIQNLNSGNLASSDVVATADNGDDNGRYINMGIASSTYNVVGFGVVGPNDGYLYVAGNSYAGPFSNNSNLNIGSTTGSVRTWVGAGTLANVVTTVSPGSFTVNGTISTTGNISGNYILGNGSQLTGLPATYSNANVAAYLVANPQSGTYSNTNVAAFLPTYTGNISSGNISTGVITLTNGAVIKDTTGLAIGYQAGYTGQRQNAIAIGVQAGYTGQGNNAVAIGTFTGVSNQGNNSIILNATGATLDQTTANTFTVSPIRNDVANVAQVVFYNTTSKEVTYGNTINVAGNVTGNYILGDGSQLTGIVPNFGNANVTVSAVSINNSATVGTTLGVTGNATVGNLITAGQVTVTGNISSGNISTGVITLTNGAVIRDTAGEAVAFGQDAGLTSQGTGAVAIGVGAGSTTQGDFAVAVGLGAGQITQGISAVAIGNNAGPTNQGNNSIIINASGNALNQTTANTFTVAPVRNDISTANVAQVMFYNVTSKEVTYGNTISIAGNVTGGNILTGGLISATGNVSGNFILGNGSQLTGIVASPSSNIVNGNSNVSVATSNGNVTVTSNGTNTWTFDTTGNLVIPGTSGGLIKTVANGAIAIAAMNNGTDNPAQLLSWRTTQPNPDTIVSAYANSATIMTDVNGTAKTWTFSNIGNLSAPGSVSATGNITGGNVLTGGLISATGNITGGNLNVTGNIVDTGALTIITGSSGNVTLAPNGTTVLIATTTGIVGNVLAATTATAANNVGYLGMPQNATGTATLTIADAGRHIYVTSASQTITIPANSSVAFPIGTAIAFIAGPSATTVSIAITTDTMYLAGAGTTGTRTLAAYGMATAVKVAATTWYINGSGLT